MLTLRNLFDAEGVEPERVLLIRHNGVMENVKACFNAGFVREFTSMQSRGIFRNAADDRRDPWMTFIGTGDGGTRLYRVYRLVGRPRPIASVILPEDFPEESAPNPDDLYYPLEESGIMSDYEGLLTVDWRSERNYVRLGDGEANDFRVASISPEPFPGYDSLIADNMELARMLANPARYGEWIRALSRVHAVYLILEPVDGGLYVGSATGGDGLWGRWSEYARNGHGGNAILHRLLADHPERRNRLQYSILRILDPGIPLVSALRLESEYKRKLGSRAIALDGDDPDYRQLNAN